MSEQTPASTTTVLGQKIKKKEEEKLELLKACKGWNKHCSEVQSALNESCEKVETLQGLLPEYENKIVQLNQEIMDLKFKDKMDGETLREMRKKGEDIMELKEEVDRKTKDLRDAKATNIKLILKLNEKSSMVWLQFQTEIDELHQQLRQEKKVSLETIQALMGEKKHLQDQIHLLLKFECNKNCTSVCLLHICNDIEGVYLCEDKLHKLAVLSLFLFNPSEEDLVQCSKSFQLFNRCGFLINKRGPTNVNGLDNLKEFLSAVENSLKDGNTSQAAVLSFSFSEEPVGHSVVLARGKLFDPQAGAEVEIEKYASASSVEASVVNIDEIRRMVKCLSDKDPSGYLSCSHDVQTNSLDATQPD